MIFLSDRVKLEKLYREWVGVFPVKDCPLSLIAFLNLKGLLNEGKVLELVKGEETKAVDTMTYGDIFKEFLEETNIMPSHINDWRPAIQPYFETSLAHAIIVWLKNGNEIVFISAKSKRMEKEKKDDKD